MGFRTPKITRLAWVSESITGTVYIKNSLLLNKLTAEQHNQVQQAILAYANTPLSLRSEKFAIVLGNTPQSRAVVAYSKDNDGLQIVHPRLIHKLKCFHFTEKDFQQLCNHLPEKSQAIAKLGKTPLSKVNY